MSWVTAESWRLSSNTSHTTDLSSLLPRKFREVARTTGFGWGAAEGRSFPFTCFPCPQLISSSPLYLPPTSHTDYPSPQADACTSPPPASPLGLGPELRHLSSHPSLRPSASSSRPNSPIPTSPKSMKSARGGGGERRPLLGNGWEEETRRVSHRSTESTVILADYMAKPSLPLPLVIAHQLGLYFAA